jgi:deoxyhypusine synthase
MTEENIDDALKSVFAKSTEMPKNSVEVRGFDFDKSNNINDMISRNFYQIGFQATQLGKAIDLVNQMV